MLKGRTLEKDLNESGVWWWSVCGMCVCLSERQKREISCINISDAEF